MEHDLSRSCYPQSSVDVREESEYHSLESTRVVACRSAATEQRCRDGFSARAAHPRESRRADDVHGNGRSGIDAVGDRSSDVLNGSSIVSSADVSRHARADSIVLGLLDAHLDLRVLKTSGVCSVSEMNHAARASTEPNARMMTETGVIQARQLTPLYISRRCLALRAR